MKSILKSIIVSLLQIEARLVLWRFKPKIVAITGSVGKTSTKDAVYTALSTGYRVRKSDKSFNSEIGVPLTILGLPNGWDNPILWVKNILQGFWLIFFSRSTVFPDWLVLEVGADKPGDIEKISRWLSPDVVVLTRFAEVPVHIEFFPSRQRLIEEKGFLVKALKVSGTLVLNNDDSDMNLFKDVIQNKITYGMTGDSDVKATGEEVAYEISGANPKPIGLDFIIKNKEIRELVKLRGVLGYQHIYPVLAAVAVAISQGLQISPLIRAFEKHIFPNGRMRLISGVKSSLIIDDSYNSSPVAAQAAIDTLGRCQRVGRRVAVLGDMFELGQYSKDAHLGLGKYLADKTDFLIVVGLRAREIASGALQIGMPENQILQYDSTEDALKEINLLIKNDDIILMKGSQGMRMEKLVSKIMADPLKAREFLVRQDQKWQQR